MKICHEVEEAKKRICPMSLNTLESALRCSADDCMAWRWVRTHIKNPEFPTGNLIESDDTHGFCGMAIHPKENPIS